MVNVIPVTEEMTGPLGALPVRMLWPGDADIKTTGGKKSFLLLLLATAVSISPSLHGAEMCQNRR